MDWEGIEPSTSALRTRHYTTKPPALNIHHKIGFYSFAQLQIMDYCDQIR